MTTSASVSVPRAGGGHVIIFAGCLLFGAALTVAATIIGNGSVVISAAAVAVALAVVATWFAPLRIPLLIVTFLSLALDATGEGPWNSPLAPIGAALVLNLNKTVPIQALTIPGVVAILAYLVLIHVHRTIRGVKTDSKGRIATPAISVQALGISLLGVFGLCALGALSGGDIQMAKVQVQTFVTMLIVAFLYPQALRRPRDYRLFWQLVLVAACIKSVYTIWVYNTVIPPFEMANGKLAFASTHGDSMLFALATVLLVVTFAENPCGRTAAIGLGVLPLLCAGMLANNRRLVWVEVAAGIVLLAIVSRRSRLKRFASRAVILAIPLILLYIAAGWNSGSQVFAPVRTFRSVGDSDVDSSTMYRELENFNLMQTMRLNPFMGTGFGHPFTEVVVLPNIAGFFKEYKYMPHNSILGLWAYCGAFGFSALMICCVVGTYMAARSYRMAQTTDQRVAALMTMAAVLIYLVHCWGDIGFSERKSIFLLGPAIGIAGQLAVSTGAWKLRAPQRAS